MQEQKHDLQWLVSLQYTPEQQELIDAAVRKAREEPEDSYVQYSFSERLVAKGNQLFAVFGRRAREVQSLTTIEDADYAFDYLPVVVDGQMIEEVPDEGRSGLLMLMRGKRLCGQEQDNPPWITSYMQTGWLYTKELAMSAEEIEQNIVNEIMRGETPLSGGKPGWM